MTERAMAPCPPNSDLMKAWNAYQGTEDFKNTLYWATTENRMRPERAEELGVDPHTNVASPELLADYRKGSLWAAFVAGFAAAGGKTTF